MRHAAIEDQVAKHVPENAYSEQWDTKGLREELKRVLDLDLPVDEWAKEEGIADEELRSRIERRADEHMASKVAQWGAEIMRYVEKSILLENARPSLREHLVDARASTAGASGCAAMASAIRSMSTRRKHQSGSRAMSTNLRRRYLGIRCAWISGPLNLSRRRPCPIPGGAQHQSITGLDEMAMADAPLFPPSPGNGQGTARAGGAQIPTTFDLGEDRPKI